jgi:hypothetical protein
MFLHEYALGIFIIEFSDLEKIFYSFDEKIPLPPSGIAGLSWQGVGILDFDFFQADDIANWSEVNFRRYYQNRHRNYYTAPIGTPPTCIQDIFLQHGRQALYEMGPTHMLQAQEILCEYGAKYPKGMDLLWK